MHSFTRPFSNATVVCVYVLGTHTGRRPGFCLLGNSQQRKGEAHMSMKSSHWVFLTVSQLRRGKQCQFSVGRRKIKTGTIKEGTLQKCHLQVWVMFPWQTSVGKTPGCRSHESKDTDSRYKGHSPLGTRQQPGCGKLALHPQKMCIYLYILTILIR